MAPVCHVGRVYRFEVSHERRPDGACRIHFKDIRIGTDGLPVATYPGNGTIDLDSVLAALDELPQEIPFGFEYPGDGAPEQAIIRGKEFVEARSRRDV